MVPPFQIISPSGTFEYITFIMYLDIAYKSRHIVKKNVPRKNKSTYNLERRGYKIFTEILKDKLNGLPTQGVLQNSKLTE